jgi:hypothetical protein
MKIVRPDRHQRLSAAGRVPCSRGIRTGPLRREKLARLQDEDGARLPTSDDHVHNGAGVREKAAAFPANPLVRIRSLDQK